MMALGITAWVTSRKWTLGPSYVNNSRVIETLPGCHWGPSPAPATHCIHLLACDRASVPNWPLPRWPPHSSTQGRGIITHRRRHNYGFLSQLSSTRTFIARTWDWSDKEQTEARNVLLFVTWDNVSGAGAWSRHRWPLITGTKVSVGEGGGSCCDKLWRIFRWLWIASIQHIANTDISLNLPPWPQVTVYMELMWWEVNRNLTVDFPII